MILGKQAGHGIEFPKIQSVNCLHGRESRGSKELKRGTLNILPNSAFCSPTHDLRGFSLIGRARRLSVSLAIYKDTRFVLESIIQHAVSLRFLTGKNNLRNQKTQKSGKNLGFFDLSKKDGIFSEEIRLLKGLKQASPFF